MVDVEAFNNEVATIRAAQYARTIKAMQAEIAELEEAVSNYKDKLAEVLPEGEQIVGDNENGYLKVTVYQSKAYNEAYGKKNAPELWEAHAVPTRVLTSAAAKAALSPEEYALFQKASDKTSVKVEVLRED